MSSTQPRLFILACDNRKRRKPGTPHKEVVCEGVQFSGGRIALDTTDVQAGWQSLAEMEEALNWWGNCAVTWLDEQESESA